MDLQNQCYNEVPVYQHSGMVLHVVDGVVSWEGCIANQLENMSKLNSKLIMAELIET